MKREIARRVNVSQGDGQARLALIFARSGLAVLADARSFRVGDVLTSLYYSSKNYSIKNDRSALRTLRTERLWLRRFQKAY